MALPAVALAALIPMLAKVPGALKALYASKHFWPAAIGGTFLGSEALGQMGKAGDRGVSREEIQLQKLLAEASAEATKTSVKESRAQTTKYMEELAKNKRAEAKEAREAALMQSYVGSQNRQMAMVLQAMQGVAQSVPNTGAQPSRVGSGMAGMVGMMGRSY